MGEAVLLVGGKGTRLRPLTVNTPKPMLATAGVPFLHHVLARARDAGIDHVVLATSYRPEVFRDGIGDGSSLGLRVDYVTEDVPMGTGGGIRNVAGLLESGPDDPVVILNGDVLSGHDLAAAGRPARLLRRGRDAAPHRGRGPARLRLRADRRAGPGDRLPGEDAEPGDQQDQRRLLRLPPVGHRRHPRRTGRCRSSERPSLTWSLPVRSCWGTWTSPTGWTSGPPLPSCAVRATWSAVSSRRPPCPARSATRCCWRARTSRRTPSSAAAPSSAATPWWVAGHVVDGSVLLDRAVVGAGATVRGSVIGASARVGDRTMLDGVVVGDDASVGADNELAPGARVWCDAVLPDRCIRFSSDEAST